MERCYDLSCRHSRFTSLPTRSSEASSNYGEEQTVQFIDLSRRGRAAHALSQVTKHGWPNLVPPQRQLFFERVTVARRTFPRRRARRIRYRPKRCTGQSTTTLRRTSPHVALHRPRWNPGACGALLAMCMWLEVRPPLIHVVVEGA